MLIKMQVFDLRAKPCLISDQTRDTVSSKCPLGIKVNACDPNMPHLLAVALVNN